VVKASDSLVRVQGLIERLQAGDATALDGLMERYSSRLYRLAFGTEYYQLARGKPGSELPESDLFAGIS